MLGSRLFESVKKKECAGEGERLFRLCGVCSVTAAIVICTVI